MRTQMNLKRHFSFFKTGYENLKSSVYPRARFDILFAVPPTQRVCGMEIIMKYRGIIITNSYLITDKFMEHCEWLKAAGEKYDADMKLYMNDELISGIGDFQFDSEMGQIFEDALYGTDFIIYWDKDIRMGNMLTQWCKKKHIPIYNTVDSINACDDKAETYFRMWRWNMEHPDDRIPLIPTIIAPMTYPNIGYTNTRFLDDVAGKLGYPVVVKECFGSFGMQVYKADNMDELRKITIKYQDKPLIYQKFIAQSSGRDLRLQVVGDKVVAAMYRYSTGDAFQSNITYGGSMKNYKPSDKECKIAIAAAGALKLDFAGVDLLFSGGEDNGADIVCEVNSNAHFKNIFNCTGVNVAEKIIEHIIADIDKNGR